MISPNSIELLTKTVVWRAFSMLFGTWITYLFTGDVVKSTIMVLVSGLSLTVLQWFFEIVWDRNFREKLRNAISRKQG
jgi:uncharacterized membrane protein